MNKKIKTGQRNLSVPRVSKAGRRSSLAQDVKIWLEIEEGLLYYHPHPQLIFLSIHQYITYPFIFPSMKPSIHKLPLIMNTHTSFIQPHTNLSISLIPGPTEEAQHASSETCILGLPFLIMFNWCFVVSWKWRSEHRSEKKTCELAHFWLRLEGRLWSEAIAVCQVLWALPEILAHKCSLLILGILTQDFWACSRIRKLF